MSGPGNSTPTPTDDGQADGRPRRRLGSPRWLIAAGLIAIVVLIVVGANLSVYYAPPPPPELPPPTGGTAEEQLAARYAPAVYIRRQDGECDRSGEAYVPAPVETVLGNAAVALRQISTDGGPDPVIKQGPTAADLAGKGPLYYLDLPGNSLNPGCSFERDAKARMVDRAPAVYAHLVQEAGTEQLALQYWFWYYFDDFVNTHEGDWEMIQVIFDATTATEALEEEPTLVAYAQHGGGEVAAWESAKLQHLGTRPVVFSAAGSHAAYYGSNLYLGWGKDGTGLGCDNTAAPSDLVLPPAILVPDTIDPNGPFAWLLFSGRWGERGTGPFNGPSGPQTNKQWRQPITWMNGLRPSSIAAPAVPGVGSTVTEVFCGVTGQVSSGIALFTAHPVGAVVAALGALALLVGIYYFIRRLLRESFAVYRRRWGTFVLLGLPILALALAIDLAHFLAGKAPGSGLLTNPATREAAKQAVSYAQYAVLFCLVGPATALAVARIKSGRPYSVWGIYRGVLPRLLILLGTMLALFFAPALLALTIIGIPVALWLTVRWAYVGQAVMIDGAYTIRKALIGSSRVVRGHWWRVALTNAIFTFLASVPGPLVGLLLLVLANRSVEFSNTLSGLVFACAAPFAVIGQTLLYLRLSAGEGEPVPGEATVVPEGQPQVATGATG